MRSLKQAGSDWTSETRANRKQESEGNDGDRTQCMWRQRSSATERLQAATERLEKTVRLAGGTAGGDDRRRGEDRSHRWTRLRMRGSANWSGKLEEAEQQIAELQAQAAGRERLERRCRLATMQLLAKQGIWQRRWPGGRIARMLRLTGLSLEQRVAVKAQLIRTGALGLSAHIKQSSGGHSDAI